MMYEGRRDALTSRNRLTDLDFGAIRQANPLVSIVSASLKLIRSGREWKGSCPFHADRTPSFTIFSNGDRFYCFGCGATGDVFDYVSRAQGVGLSDAARLLASGDLPMQKMPAAVAIIKNDRTPEAQAIFADAVPASDTLAEVYLDSRAIRPPFPPDIRFAWLPYGYGESMPCMVCGVRDVSGGIIGVQRIFLRQNGRSKASVAKPKLSLGRVSGGAIRLGDLNSSGVVTVCEGPETGLSLLELGGGPVWVACGVGNLPKIVFPPEIDSVVIGADNDAAGHAGAIDAARVYAARGLIARIIPPLDGYGDFNDELKGQRYGS